MDARRLSRSPNTRHRSHGVAWQSGGGRRVRAALCRCVPQQRRRLATGDVRACHTHFGGRLGARHRANRRKAHARVLINQPCRFHVGRSPSSRTYRIFVGRRRCVVDDHLCGVVFGARPGVVRRGIGSRSGEWCRVDGCRVAVDLARRVSWCRQASTRLRSWFHRALARPGRCAADQWLRREVRGHSSRGLDRELCARDCCDGLSRDCRLSLLAHHGEHVAGRA